MILSDCLRVIKNIHDREWDFLLYKRRKLLYFLIILPIFVFTLLLAVFNKPVVREIPIAVIDQDNSEISKQLISKINASPLVNIIKQFPSPDQAKKFIANSTVYGAVIIPSDFSKKILGYKGAEVIYLYNNELFLQGGTSYKGVFNAVHEFSNEYNIKFLMSKGIPAYNAKFQLNPVIMGEHILFNPYLNYQYFFLLGMYPAIVQLLIICVVVYAFYYEEKSKSLLEIAPVIKTMPFSVIIGKLIPYVVLFLIVSAIMLFTLFVIIKAPIRAGVLTIVISTILFVIASCVTGAFIAVLFRHIAFSAAAIYAAPAFAYAGITFPQLAMPYPAFLLSEFLPLSHYHRVLINEAIRGGLKGSTSYLENIYMLIFSTIALFVTTFIFIHLSKKLSMGAK